MALGTEVVARNDPEEESKPVDELIAEILGETAENVGETPDSGSVSETVGPPEENSNENAVETTENSESVEENTNIDEVVTTDSQQDENVSENAVVLDEEAESEAEVGGEEDVSPPAEEEEEEEVDLIDPVDEVRQNCESEGESQKYLSKLEECNGRVNSRTKTDESCHEEMMDWVHSVDHCVSSKLFSKLK